MRARFQCIKWAELSVCNIACHRCDQLHGVMSRRYVAQRPDGCASDLSCFPGASWRCTAMRGARSPTAQSRRHRKTTTIIKRHWIGTEYCLPLGRQLTIRLQRRRRRCWPKMLKATGLQGGRRTAWGSRKPRVRHTVRNRCAPWSTPRTRCKPPDRRKSAQSAGSQCRDPGPWVAARPQGWRKVCGESLGYAVAAGFEVGK